MKGRYLFLLSALVFFLTSCAFNVTIPPNTSNPYRSVAVLPIYNATNDIDGPRMVRELIDKRIQKFHYAVKPMDEVDQILRDQMGITLGSQLDLATPQQLGTALGVDALIYGYLLNFETVTAGVYNVKKVRAGFTMVDTKTGRVIWSHGQGVKSDSAPEGVVGAAAKALKDAQDRKEGLESYKSIKGVTEIPMLADWHKMSSQQDKNLTEAAVFSLGEKLVTKALGVHLKPESETMLNLIMTDFPVGPGTAVAMRTEPAISMPKMEVETPSFGVPAYMDFGDRDFTSDVIMTTYMKSDKKEMKVNGKLARRGKNFRNDMDMTSAMKAEGVEGAEKLSKMTFIVKESEKKNFTLYPEMKKYIENRFVDEKGKEPKIDKVKIGEETIDGHKTVKYKVTITEEGRSHSGFFWEAKDLSNFVIRAEFEEKDARFLMELKNVKLASPPQALFNIPQDYSKASNYMELMMEGAGAGKQTDTEKD